MSNSTFQTYNPPKDYWTQIGHLRRPTIRQRQKHVRRNSIIALLVGNVGIWVLVAHLAGLV